VLPNKDPNLQLARTPALPQGPYVPVHRWQLRATASRSLEMTANALDDDPTTFWTTFRNQTAGDWFAFEFKSPEKFVALDFLGFSEAFDAPLSYELAISPSTSADGLDDFQTIASRPNLRAYADQVFSPGKFVFRVLLPEPVSAQRVRITILNPVPQFTWSIHESRLWIAP
jgi:hypothetical protein